MQTLGNEEGQLVSVLTGRRHSDRPCKQNFCQIRRHPMETRGLTLPVVVEMAEFVAQALHVIRLQSALVVDHVVRDRSDSSLANALRNQVEVVAGTEEAMKSERTHQSRSRSEPFATSDHRVDHGSRRRIHDLLLCAALIELEKARAHSFRHNCERERHSENQLTANSLVATLRGCLQTTHLSLNSCP